MANKNRKPLPKPGRLADIAQQAAPPAPQAAPQAAPQQQPAAPPPGGGMGNMRRPLSDFDPNANGGWARKMAARNQTLAAMARNAVLNNRFGHMNAVNAANRAGQNLLNRHAAFRNAVIGSHVAGRNAVHAAHNSPGTISPAMAGGLFAVPDQRDGVMNRAMGTPKKVNPNSMLQQPQMPSPTDNRIQGDGRLMHQYASNEQKLPPMPPAVLAELDAAMKTYTDPSQSQPSVSRGHADAPAPAEPASPSLAGTYADTWMNQRRQHSPAGQLEALRERIAEIPELVPPEARADLQADYNEVVEAAKNREHARQMGGVPVDVAVANQQGQQDTQDIIARATQPGRQDILNSAWEAQKARQQEAFKQIEEDVGGWADRRRALDSGAPAIDTDGDGTPDVGIQEAYGKFGVKSVADLEKVTHDYHNYGRQFKQAAPANARKMSFQEFIKWKGEQEKQMQPWVPGQGGAPQAAAPQAAPQGGAPPQQAIMAPPPQLSPRQSRARALQTLAANQSLNRAAQQQQALVRAALMGNPQAARLLEAQTLAQIEANNAAVDLKKAKIEGEAGVQEAKILGDAEVGKAELLADAEVKAAEVGLEGTKAKIQSDEDIAKSRNETEVTIAKETNKIRERSADAQEELVKLQREAQKFQKLQEVRERLQDLDDEALAVGQSYYEQGLAENRLDIAKLSEESKEKAKEYYEERSSFLKAEAEFLNGQDKVTIPPFAGYKPPFTRRGTAKLAQAETADVISAIRELRQDAPGQEVPLNEVLNYLQSQGMKLGGSIEKDITDMGLPAWYDDRTNKGKSFWDRFFSDLPVSNHPY